MASVNRYIENRYIGKPNLEFLAISAVAAPLWDALQQSRDHDSRFTNDGSKFFVSTSSVPRGFRT